MITRVLVPTDFSAPSLTAVRSGIALATTVGGVVILLHVVEGVPIRCYAVGEFPLFLGDILDLGGEYVRFWFDQQLIRRDVCEEARWKLDALIPPRCQALVHTVVTVGRAVDEIVRVAKEQHADLILLGARSLRGWRRVFRKTMADRVRRKTLIPVVALDVDDLRVGRDPEHSQGSRWALDHDRAACQLSMSQNGGSRLNYMSLICIDELSLSATRQEECDAESAPHVHQLKLRGQHLATTPPRPPSTASVGVRRSKALVTDGPFAETREHLGG